MILIFCENVWSYYVSAIILWISPNEPLLCLLMPFLRHYLQNLINVQVTRLNNHINKLLWK